MRLQQYVSSGVPGNWLNSLRAPGKRHGDMERDEWRDEDGEAGAQRWCRVLLLNECGVPMTTGRMRSALAILVWSFTAVMAARPTASRPVAVIFVCCCFEFGESCLCGWYCRKNRLRASQDTRQEAEPYRQCASRHLFQTYPAQLGSLQNCPSILHWLIG